MRALRELSLVQGRGALPKRLVQCCHQGRLVGGLSISLQASPDEVVGPLTHAMGGAAKTLKVLDVRSTKPLVMEVALGELKEKWELEDVASLVHNLNDLFCDQAQVKLMVVLGEWQDMVQLWALPRELLLQLLERRCLDDALNTMTLRRLVERS